MDFDFGVDALVCARAVARENGRATPRLFPGSGRPLAIVDRRPGVLTDFGGGDRPAGLRIGAERGVTGAIFRGVERRGVMLVLWVVVRAMRDVLRGLGEPFAKSSSSILRLRLVDKVRVFGSMFSASSMKMEVLAEFFADKVAPGDVRCMYQRHDESTIPFC